MLVVGFTAVLLSIDPCLAQTTLQRDPNLIQYVTVTVIVSVYVAAAGVVCGGTRP
jgi:hypothetical protein